jgi:hypothetical protein
MLRVKCYSSYTYAQEPCSFTWQGEEVRIEQIQSAWQEPGKRLFRVATEEGKRFELCYNETAGQWSAIEL